MNTNKEDWIAANHELMKAINFADLNSKNLNAEEIKYLTDLSSMINTHIDEYVKWLESDEARKYFFDNVKLNKEVFEAIDEKLDDIIYDTKLSAKGITEKLYEAGLKEGYNDLGEKIVWNDATANALKITQVYGFGLITNLSNDLTEQIRHHIFRGIAEGQSIPEIAKAIKNSGLQPLNGSTLTAYQRATMIARTEVSRAMNTGKLQSYANYGVEMVDVVTAGDERVCEICIYNEENNPHPINESDELCPAHPNCRCTVIAHIEHKSDIEEQDNPLTVDITVSEKEPFNEEV